MKPEARTELVIAGILLSGLSIWARYVDANVSAMGLWAGVGGGVLCVLWGAVGGSSRWGRIAALVTLGLVGAALAWQAATLWTGSVNLEKTSRMGAVLMTLLVLVCLMTLLNVKAGTKVSGPPTTG